MAKDSFGRSTRREFVRGASAGALGGVAGNAAAQVAGKRPATDAIGVAALTIAAGSVGAALGSIRQDNKTTTLKGIRTHLAKKIAGS
jgi:hypothetical protein